MGGLRALAFAAAAGMIVQAAPAAQAVPGRLPGGRIATVRLAFRQGVQVETRHLPKRFLSVKTGAWASYQELTPEGKLWALHALFPEDRWTMADVRHKVRWPELESVWLMSSLFVGHGQHYDKLQAANAANPEKLRKGDVWVIPRLLLARELGGAGQAKVDRTQPEDDLDDEAKVAAYRALLTFEEDREGKYAAYHLRKGEALYTSVVMRYTDRVDPKGVGDLALELARRSGIEDVRGIQPGQLVKIPLQVLAGPFQTEGSKALAEEREVRAEVRRTPKVEAGPRLKGIRIVLDAGHGGIDKGASGNGAWESDFVYDITMRVLRVLQQDTEAVVSCTIRYPGLGFNVRDSIREPSSAAEILTTPPFANDGENPNAVSVHLRWVLANDLFSEFCRNGDPQKTLFLSFHADSLHPSARGTMVYVPGAAGVPGDFSLGDRRAARVKEMKAGSHVHFTSRERLQGEARSRLFAEGLLQALRKDELPIHGNRPIRNIIQRAGQSFVPAVIRYNTAATKVLIEVANLTNEDDVDNLKDFTFRERYAEAVVKAVKAYYRN